MNSENIEHLQYPIGKFKAPSLISEIDVKKWIETIECFPLKLSALVKSLKEVQLDTTYRKNGWTIRQVIHHCYDSHHHSYTRFKWALTEEKPIIKAYNESRWADLFDSKKAPIQLSLDAMKALHAKWVYLLKGLNESDLNSVFYHPETKEKISLKKNIGIYAWHCDHHYAHIQTLIERKNWN